MSSKSKLAKRSSNDSGGYSVSKRSRGAKASGGASAVIVAKSSTFENLKNRTVKVTAGEAPVDSECPQDNVVVFSEQGVVYDAMLNQTNVGSNNNKFYILQILKSSSNSNYYTWFRWGRIGYSGQNKLTNCGSNLEQAKNLFYAKFRDKTKNEWSERADFIKFPNKYDLVAIDYATKANKSSSSVGGKGKDVDTGDSSQRVIPDSKLDARLQQLIQMIFDLKAMEESVVELKYDAQKTPLGLLTKEQIKAGFQALKRAESCIRSKKMGSELTIASSDYYTRIPHYFGMKPPPKLTTTEMIQEEVQLLEALADIEVAVTIINSSPSKANPIDSRYNSLQCKLEPLDRTDRQFQIVDRYLRTTHAPTHSLYQMELLDVYSCSKESQLSSFDSSLHNKMLLWHGSRMLNWAGILSKGLCIAPPEAPITGHMFGKGIYFADMSSKSANYCYPSKKNNIGLLTLCVVALGDSMELKHADYTAGNKLKKDGKKQSVKGLGRTVPNPAITEQILDDVKVPCGPPVSSTPKSSTDYSYSLLYNEYIVYNPNQVRLQYLCKVKFNFS